MFTLHLRHIMGRGELLVNFHGLVWVEATSLGVNIEPGLQSVLYPFHLASSTEGFCSCTVCTAHYYVGLGAGFSYFPTSLVVNSEICIICIKFISHSALYNQVQRGEGGSPSSSSSSFTIAMHCLVTIIIVITMEKPGPREGFVSL